MRSAVFRYLWTLLLVLFPAAALAQQVCTLPGDLRTDVRPNADGPTTEVTGSFFVLDFLGVDDVNQQIELDLVINLAWNDPRLVGLEGCRFQVSEVWFPPMVLLNSSNLRTLRNQARDQVAVGADGEVTYFQRFSGRISSYHSLRRFPFDNQLFPVEVMSPTLSAADFRFVPDNQSSSISPRLNIEGWRLSNAELSESVETFAVLPHDVSVMTLTIDAQRLPNYYIFRLLLPLIFVVAMSWAIFWVPPARYEFQIGLGATSMLTTIAFTLSIASQLPSLGYLTLIDKMLIWALFLVFLSIVEALISGLLYQTERENRAKQLDRICRVVFPIALIGGWWIIAA